MSGADENPASSTRIPGFSLAAVGVTSFGGEGFQLGQLSPGADPVALEEGIAARRASEEERWQKAMDDLRAAEQQDGAGPSGLTGGAAVGGGRQGTIDQYVTTRVGERQLREGLVMQFAGLDMSFRSIVRPAFRDFVTLLNPVVAQYLSTRFRLARDLLSAAETAKAQLRQLLTGDGLAGRVTLTTDIWTSENNVAFMVVTAHRVTSDFQLQQMVIDFRSLEGRHTGDKNATELEEVIGEWALGGGEFFGVTTDNAENNNRAVRLLSGVLDDTPGSRLRDPPVTSLARHFKCVAHVLNLAVQYAFKIEPVAEALRRLRAVASYIGWSMVVRGCELPIPLTMYFDESSLPNITKTTRTAWAEIRLSDAHWTALNELRAFLEPFDSIILKLERHMGRVSEECAIATFLDPWLKTATFRLSARGARPTAPIVVTAGGHAMGARTLDLTEERVKALVRERLPPYQTAARAAAETRLGGEVTSARGVTGEGAARSGAAGRRGARSRGVLDFQARLFSELAEMEAEEGVRAQDEVGAP
ncbi:unnamed protein product [Closterium sp. Yama58-4]|nr:unnamed protein product [Closterium sp. Yama58-4]